MSNITRFAAYATAFEETVADDNWQRLDQYFTADAVYLPGDGTEAKGRDGVIQALSNSVNNLDRRFDSRTPQIEDPAEEGNLVMFTWKVVFGKQGAPDLEISGTEHLTFKGQEISHMEDVFDEGVPAALDEWMEKYGD